MKDVVTHPQFLGAMLGFFGVICTLVWNAWLSRAADERRFNADRIQKKAERTHGRNALRQAIIADLEIFCETLRFEIDVTRKPETNMNSISPNYLNVAKNEFLNLKIFNIEEIRLVVKAVEHTDLRMETLSLYGRIENKIDGITKGRIWIDFENKFEGRKDVLDYLAAVNSNCEKAASTLRAHMEQG